MSTEMLERRFATIGARVRVSGDGRGEPRIDIRSDRLGEFFEAVRRPRRRGRSRGNRCCARREASAAARASPRGEGKFLCGHDERHRFVAAVPESAHGVTGVRAAKAALQPPLVREAIERTRPKEAFPRRTSAYVRQGEARRRPVPPAAARGAAARSWSAIHSIQCR